MNNSVRYPQQGQPMPNQMYFHLRQMQQQQQQQQQQQNQGMNNPQIQQQHHQQHQQHQTHHQQQNQPGMQQPPHGSNQMNPQINQQMMQQQYMNQPQAVKEIHSLIADLIDPDKKEYALQELSKRRQDHGNIAPELWFSTGTIASLLAEIVSIYPLLNGNLTQEAATKVVHALSLFQCIASHDDTFKEFMSSQIPFFLFPFLNSKINTKPLENVRITSLGVIGSLVTRQDKDVIQFLISIDIIPVCLRIMGDIRVSENIWSQIVSTFIIRRILMTDTGLRFICEKQERYVQVEQALSTIFKIVINSRNPNKRLIKYIVKCYLQLTHNPTVVNHLIDRLPEEFYNPEIFERLYDEHLISNRRTVLLNIGKLDERS